MPTFMMSLNWTDQGIRAVKDSPKRSEDARELAKKVGVEIKHLYLTSGDSDLVIFVDAPSGDNVAKFALAVSSLGNVRTRTVRAWSADEYRKLISELPQAFEGQLNRLSWPSPLRRMGNEHGQHAAFDPNSTSAPRRRGDRMM